ncbi:MAG: spore germination protein [Clostridiales bacterium]|nr:spore germination protein [Clostridiales bacterium]
MSFSISTDLKQNMEYFNQVLRVDENFDIIYQTFEIGGKKACLYFVDGFTKDEILQKLLVEFEGYQEGDVPEDIHGFIKKKLPYIELDVITEEQAIIKNLLSGVTILFIDGYQSAIAMDCRTYPARSVDEPEKDKVMRGSRDGFVETIVFNTALIRRRIRSPQLVNKMLEVGTSSRTDVVISYMEGRCNEKILKKLMDKIQTLDVDSLSMNQESLAECLFKRLWFNPFPKFKYTERPDTAAACILEGSIIVLVDNSPAAMIIPCTIFDIIQEADDYYFPPFTGTYLRLSRIITDLIALVITPLFVLLMNNPDLIPKGLEFIKVKEEMNIPLVWQFLILEFAVDGLRLASINTPSMLSTPLSVAAALIIGDFTVSSGWFNAEAMLYMAFVMIANYTQANYELGYAIKFLRILILILTSIFDVWGFAIGVVIAIASFAFNKTFTGTSYIYPLIPFNGRKLFRKLCRTTLPNSKNQ